MIRLTRRIVGRHLPPVVAEPIRRAIERRRSREDWEYRPAGWPDGDPSIHGWDVESILATQLARWPAFVRSVGTAAPLGMSNEAADPGQSDLRTHNTIMSFGYVLARAARGRDGLSVLDWGGGIGHYQVYARALLPEVELDYHCRELPLLTRGGRQVLPDATFHDSDESALARRYDLVLASGSLNYTRDWRDMLAKLAAVAGPYLYVTRLPLVETAPSFVFVQRAHRHGYLTEFPGWALNRDEFLGQTRALGLELLREFLIAGRLIVPGAPEQMNDKRGFLFAAPSGRRTA